MHGENAGIDNKKQPGSIRLWCGTRLFRHDSTIEIVILSQLNRYFVEKQGKRYLYSWFRTPHPAVISAPEDWAKQDVPIVINPELCKDCLFTVNQLLSLSGFYSGLLHRGCGVLHSSYVAVGDRAILFAGFSGQGKSTQAELWRQYRGAEIINGDRALIFRRKGSWYAGGLSVCGSSQICVNRTVKIAALILLEKSKKNVVCPVAAAARCYLLTGLLWI